jgi:transcriptional regulator with XRE-family HTH domain
MKSDIFPALGEQLLRARRAKGYTQPDLAERLGRDRARISDFERDLRNDRLGRDRLTLFAEMCDALDLIPVLMPRAEARPYLDRPHTQNRVAPSQPTPFDELFVDLSGEDDD